MQKFNKRIVIIEFDSKFRNLLSSLVDASQTYVTIAAYAECEEALENLRSDFPDIVVMNTRFPGMQGAEAIDEIRKVLPHADILIVADPADEQAVFHTISMGANGYLLKSDCVYNFVAHLDELAHGGSPISPSVARMIIESIHIARVTPLTSRETEVLRLITQGNSYSLIAKELNISKETSKTHIRNIYKKLNVSSKSQVVRRAMEERYVSAARLMTGS
jgi:DNA-binding NarL/FixJ family response regulator